MLLFGLDFGAFGGRFWGPFGVPLGPLLVQNLRKIGAKFDQKIVDNKNHPKMTPRESKSPPGTPQGRPRTPQGRPRTPPGAPREPPSWPNTENPPTKTMVFYKLLVSLDDFPESWKLRSCQVEMRRSRGIRGFCYIVLL